MKKLLLIVILILSGCAYLGASKVFLDGLPSLKVGMNKEEVFKIIGRGKLQPSIDNRKIYEYQPQDQWSGVVETYWVIFKSNKLKFFGLKGAGIYDVEIISDPPGAKIEWGNEYVGETPLNVTVRGCRAGSILVIANPVSEGQYVQKKILSCSQGMPRKIYFNMRLIPTGKKYEIDLNHDIDLDVE